MAVKQRQRLACMHGLCHATQRQRTGLQTTLSQLIPRPRFCKHVLGPRLSARLPATFTDVLFRSRTLCISVELVVPLILGAGSVELQIALSFAADGKDKQRDADAALQGQHELQRHKSLNELHLGVAQGASTSITGAAPCR